MTSRVVHTDPDILGSTPVFVGTRVPVKNLLDYLEAGRSLEEFLESFPSVTREQAAADLVLAHQALIADAHPAWDVPILWLIIGGAFGWLTLQDLPLR